MACHRPLLPTWPDQANDAIGRRRPAASGWHHGGVDPNPATPPQRQPPVAAVVGATASGKSGLAVDLALRLDGEVVNGDAMAIYRGMDTGTAKPSLTQQRGVPHHLLDVLDVDEPAAVAWFQTQARTAIGTCRDRGRLPILVGGSALYVRAVLDAFDFPGTDPDVRRRWEGQLAAVGSRALHQTLQERDPRAADIIEPTNGRRLVRALEVIEITGGPFQASLPEHVYAFDRAVQVGLDVPREVLDSRIEARVAQMWEHGLVEEVRRLRWRGLEGAPTASRALGYRQVLAHLAGECTEREAQEQTVRATRKFVRRQLAWFRRDPRIVWLAYDDPNLLIRAEEAVRSVW